MKASSIPVLSAPILKKSINETPDLRWTDEGEDALVVLVTDQSEWLFIRETLSPTRRASVPLLGFSPFPAADAAAESHNLDGALAAIRPLLTRMAAVPEPLLQDDDEASALLAYLWVREARLKPVSDASLPRVVDFAERARFSDLDELIACLTKRCLLHADFEERLNCCPNCNSARLLVRDQCARCGSSNIVDQAVIHHFPCACQAPEKAFGNEDGELRCPKCRRLLHHVSIDYEVSSDLCECLSCGVVTGQPVAGFRCLDCGSSGLGQDLVEWDVHSYSLTAAARALFQQEVPRSCGPSKPVMAAAAG